MITRKGYSVSKLLSRDDILRAEDLSTVTVDVPEWGGVVSVGTLTGSERDRFESEFMSGAKSAKRMDNIRAKLCALTIRNEDGTPTFNAKDVSELGKKSASALDRVFTVALKHNGFSNDDVEELAGNSKATTGVGST